MEIEFIIKVFSTVFIASLGWVAAHYFTSRRDMENKRREIQTQYLIEVYQKLDEAIEPAQYTREWCELLQHSFSKIQLFGTKQQIALAHEFAEIMRSQEEINQALLKELMQSLRISLRKELGLESTDSNIGYIRIYETNT